MVDAGRLSIDVEADVTGFARGLQSRVDAAVRNVSAKIALELDERGFRQKVQAAVRSLSGLSLTVDINADVDLSRATARLKEFISRPWNLTIDVDVNLEGARSNLDRFIHERRTINVDVDTHGGGAGGGGGGANLPNFGGATGGASAFAGALGLVRVAAMALAVSALPAVVGGLAALTAAVGPAAGAVLALPGAFSAVAQGAAVLMSALHGVGAAVKAGFAAQDNAASDGQAAAAQMKQQAEARIQAAEQVKAAQEALADAESQAAERSKQAARAVSDARQNLQRVYEDSAERMQAANERVQQAEKNLSGALREERQAQEALNDARKQATRDLEDMRAQAERGQLDERQATLQVSEAQRRLDAVRQNPMSDDNTRQEAQLGYDQAVFGLQEVQRQNKRNQEDLKAANKDGVEGSKTVQSAQEQLRQATEHVADAYKDVQKAQADVAKTAKDNARAIADAQQSVTDALHQQDLTARENARSIENAQRSLAQAQRQMADAMNATVTAGQTHADAYQKALAKLSPPAQEFVRTLVGMRGEFKALSNQAAAGLFPGLTDSLHNLSPVLSALGPVFFETGKAFGDFARNFTANLKTPQWLADIPVIGHQNAQVLATLLSALIPLSNAFRDLAVATGPFVQFLADGVKGWADYAAKTAAAGRESGRTAAFMDKVKDTMRLLWDILKNVGSILYSVLKGAAPLGRDLLTTFDALTKRTADWLKSFEGQQRIKAFFDSIGPVVFELFRLIGDLGKAFINIGQNSHLAPLIAQIRTELLPAVTRLFGIITDANTGSFGTALVHSLTQIINLLGTLAQSNGSLTIFIRIIGDLAQGLDFLVRHVPGMRLLVTAIGGLLILGRVASSMNGFIRAAGVMNQLLGGPGAQNTLISRIGQLGRGVMNVQWGTFATRMGQAVRMGASAAWNGITSGLSAVGRGAANAARALGSYIATAARATGSAIASGARATGTALASIGRNAAQAARQLGTFIATQARAGASAAMNGLRSAGTAIANVGRQAATAAVNLGRLAVAQARAAGSAALNGLRTMGTALANVARQALAAAVSMARLAAAKVASAMSSIAAGVGRLIPMLRALGATMITPPLGIVLAIAAVAVGLVLLYKHSKTFRDFVNTLVRLIKTGLIAAFHGLEAAVKAVVNFIRDHWKLLIAIIGGPFGIILALVIRYWGQIKGAFSAALNFIRTIFTAIWNGIKAFFEAWWKAMQLIVTTYIHAVQTVITTVLNVVKTIWTTIWNAIKVATDVVFNAIKTAISTALNVIKTVIQTVTGVIKGIWDGFFGGIRSVAEGAMNFIRDKVGGILGTIRGAFSDAVGAIKSIWSGLSDIVAAPVRFIVNTVYNDGIRGVVNKVAGWVGVHNLLPEAHLASGGFFAADGGRTASGYSKHDVVPAMYRRGEHVLTPEEVNGLGGHRAVAQARANATGKPASLGPGQGYVTPQGASRAAAPGSAAAALAGPNAPQPRGRAANPNRRPGFSLGGALAAVGNLVIHPGRIVEAVKDVAETGAAWVADHTLKPLIDQFKGFMGQYGQWGPLLGGSVDKLYGYFHDFLVKKDQEAVTSTPGAGGAVARWAPVVMAALRQNGLPTDPEIVNGVLSLIAAESGGNPQAINLWDSNAAAGHPSQGLMQTIPTTFAANAGKYASRGITDPFANIYAGIHYALHTYGEGMLRRGGRHSGGHYVGYSEGGGEPIGMAAGGTVYATRASNRRGHVRRLAEAGRDETVVDTATLQRAVATQRGETTVNNNVTINNPKPEPASMSTAKVLRRKAALGAFSGAGR